MDLVLRHLIGRSAPKKIIFLKVKNAQISFGKCVKLRCLHFYKFK